MNPGVLILVHFIFGLSCFAAAVSARRFILFVSMAAGVIGLVLHGVFIVSRGIEARHLPWANTYETLILMSFLVVALFFVTYPKYRAIVLGGFSGLVASILLALASLLSSDIEPLLPSLKSNWLLFHVTVTILGYAFFAVAFGSAGIFLFWSWFAKSKILRRWFKPKRKLKERLEYSNWLTHRLISFGFPFLTLGITTGSIWANSTWGRYWNWDSKEAWAFATWLLYAVCLHLKREGHDKAMAALTFFGFFVVMFTYFGVNFWLSSLHAYG